jgi:hypothetical protein
VEFPRPKAEIKIEQVQVTPYSDGFRVHVHIIVTPFQERPNLVLVIHNEQDSIVSELNIIETMHHNMEFTMHLRGISHSCGGLLTDCRTVLRKSDSRAR